jgi:hypothetical protein
MQDVYNYIPKTNIVTKVYKFATIPWLQYTSLLHIMLFHVIKVSYFYITTFRNMCAVSCTAVLCSSLMSCFPGTRTLLRYFLNDFQVVPVAPIITSNTFVMFHICYIIIIITIIIIISSSSSSNSSCGGGGGNLPSVY